MGKVELILNISEIIAAIVATIYYFKYRKKNLKFILIILWLSVFTEYLSIYMYENKVLMYNGKNNYWLYNIMYPLWKFLYLYIYFNALNIKAYKNWVKSFMMLYLIALCINWIFLQNFLRDLESYSRIFGCLLVSISAIFYLLELLRSDKIIVFHKKTLFWISIGLMLFYSGSVPFIIMRDFYSDYDYIHNIFLVRYILGIVMYLLFTFGFIWSKKE